MDEVLQSLLEKCRDSSDTALYLNYMKIAEWPSILLELHMLKRLYMKQNLLEYVPREISSLASLVSLYLDSNMIEWIPDSIGDLPCLQSLDLNKNRINKLPSAIGNLSSLKSLHLSHNCISQLPSAIGNLKCLETLNLMSNELEDIPNGISGCIKLKTLQLDLNRLALINQGILRLPLLQDLSVTRNKLECLPLGIDLMESLEQLTVDANNFIEFLPGSLVSATRLRRLGLHSCEKLQPRKEYKDIKSKLRCCLDAECLQSVVPLKELCYRQIGNRIRESIGVSVMITQLPSSLIETLQTPVARCAVCSQSVYRALHIMEKPTLEVVRHYCDQYEIFSLLKSLPADVSFVFVFCSIYCREVFRRERRRADFLEIF